MELVYGTTPAPLKMVNLQSTLLLMLLVVIQSSSFTTHTGNYSAYSDSDTSNIKLTSNFKVLSDSVYTGKNYWDMPRCKYHDCSQIVKTCKPKYTNTIYIHFINPDLNLPNIGDKPEKPLFINNHRYLKIFLMSDAGSCNEIVLWEHWRNKWKEILIFNCNTEI